MDQMLMTSAFSMTFHLSLWSILHYTYKRRRLQPHLKPSDGQYYRDSVEM